jgi:phosphoribosylglycinamide formyltransferase-1
VLPGDDEATLAARVLAQEHVIYPRAVRWWLEGALAIEDGVVELRGAAGPQSVLAAA